MNIAIVGAGIGGLSTALCLEKLGMRAQIFEAADELKAVGAGIILAHNAMQVYRWLGLEEALRRHGTVLTGSRITDAELKTLSMIDLARFNTRFGVEALAIHRGNLQNTLLSVLSDSPVHTGKVLRSLSGEQGCKLQFEDGSCEGFDLLIAADGLNSAVRRQLFPQSRIRPARQHCWRGIADFAFTRQYQAQLHEIWAADFRFGFVPLSAERVYWYGLSTDSHTEKALPERFQRNKDSLPAQIIAHGEATRIHYDEIRDLEPLPCWFQQSVCLLGDAAHATTPNLGQGACQAIEDAYVLSHCLQKHPPQTAFQRYQDLRMKKANGVIRQSRLFGQLAHIKNPLASALRNFTLKHTPPQLNNRQLEKLLTLAEIEA